MSSKQNNVAYIDGANLHKGITGLGWKLDYVRFRVWLKEKYKVERAYIFIGLVPKYKDMYSFLQEAGFILIYKEVVYAQDGSVKGNCDADLVLKSAVDFYERRPNKIILVSSDGDYASLVSFFKTKGVFYTLISPSNKCSYLLRKLDIPIVYLRTQKHILAKRPQKEKALDRDETL